MATGILYSVNSPTGADGSKPSTGQVQVDETGEILAFDDPNFSTSGIQNVGDKCTFDIIPPDGRVHTVAYATNLKALVATAPPTTITGPQTGDITANVGDIITITGAAAIVTGNIIVNGGKVIIEQDAQVVGTAHSIVDGVIVARKGGQVKGGINVDGGGNLKVVNKGKIVGGINVQSGGRMIVGNDNGPGFINGAIDILKIRKLDITPDSKING